MICPICRRNVQIEPQTETLCECCKSIIFEDDNLGARIIKPNMTFSWTNFTFGVFFIAVFIICIIFLVKEKIDILNIGIILFFPTVLGILQRHIWYKYEDLQSFYDLYKALIGKRLKYYDFGSKFLMITLVFIVSIEIGLIFFGFIY